VSHLDVRMDSSEDLGQLIALGATWQWDNPRGRWTVFADAEGNLFCAIPRPSERAPRESGGWQLPTTRDAQISFRTPKYGQPAVGQHRADVRAEGAFAQAILRWLQVTRRSAAAHSCDGLRLGLCGPVRRRPLWADSSYRDAPAT